MSGNATERETGGFGLPQDILLKILGKWWYRRNEVGLFGDEWYIPEDTGRREMINVFYTAPKEEGKIPPLTPIEHNLGFKMYRSNKLK